MKVKIISNRLYVWKEKVFSMGRCITLIKSILGSLSVYYMSFVQTLVNVLNFIEQIRRNFYWGILGDKKKYVGFFGTGC